MAITRIPKGIFIVAAKRTPFGTFGGKLKNLTPTQLQEVAVKAAMKAGRINADWVSFTVIGNAGQTASDSAYISRHIGIKAGIPITSPGLTVNRLCGSGFQSIITASQGLSLGENEVVITGGAENMSMAPHAVRGFRFGVKYGVHPVLEDTLWTLLTDSYINKPMGVTAENLAEKYGITREQADEYAVLSQKRWKAAFDAGYFKKEIEPVTIKTKKGKEELMDVDEHPKPNTTLESIASLPSVFKKNGTVTAANASGIGDGASCVILATEDACVKYNIKPLARMVGYSIVGCDPHLMGIGPVTAIEHLMKKTNRKLYEMDLIEINEAFASQYLAVEKHLKLNREKTNVNGGAIAMGHPVGASGNRIIGHLVHHLRFLKAKYGLGAACIGGGQGIAMLVEAV
ncbi:hypothetical protein HELRODRAFT_186335 [Helobdella robusta]|uniref:Thiolase N-terminal domain-containing protein n=1 Tax=Helobdella robusta TaxID=6412 RepID=T1FNY7_HELRO|nr:hypothetical protein HELRODRAFT_186335 [Helobdella robusta]ESO12764.1 hypothetical protein HELRODRAFT_186335 [Helobdella robusta]